MIKSNTAKKGSFPQIHIHPTGQNFSTKPLHEVEAEFEGNINKNIGMKSVHPDVLYVMFQIKDMRPMCLHARDGQGQPIEADSMYAGSSLVCDRSILCHYYQRIRSHLPRKD